MIEIDGGADEGGGQILRVALSLACIQGKSVKIYNIRKGRPKPGLANQHMTGIHLLKDICCADVKGLELGSTEIEFCPKTVKGGSYVAHVNTAGSISLLVQVALPVALFSDSRTTIDMKGGTNTDMAPHIDFIINAFRSNLKKFNASFEFDIIKRGYFPRGGGHCKIFIDPIKMLKPVDIVDFGIVQKITGTSFVSGRAPIQMAQETKSGFLAPLENSQSIEIDIKVIKDYTSQANAIVFYASCTTSTDCVLGISALVDRNESAHNAGRAAGEKIAYYIKNQICVDNYLQDQLLIFMALANGKSRIRVADITSHTQTAIKIVELLTVARFNIVKKKDSFFVIECQGSGFFNKNNLIPGDNN